MTNDRLVNPDQWIQGSNSVRGTKEEGRIGKNLTFHLAKHTFTTTITLSIGAPIETVRSMLGHSSIKPTQI